MTHSEAASDQANKRILAVVSGRLLSRCERCVQPECPETVHRSVHAWIQSGTQSNAVDVSWLLHLIGYEIKT
jgi:hypothetical protein